jgi:hypothetical protein
MSVIGYPSSLFALQTIARFALGQGGIETRTVRPDFDERCGRLRTPIKITNFNERTTQIADSYQGLFGPISKLLQIPIRHST